MKLRLLHTADWHLGRSLRDFSRDREHARFADWLLETLAREEIDALAVAGDVFDSGNPSAAAQRTWYRFLALALERCPKLDIVIAGGNHDSPARLEAPRDLVEASGRVRVVGALPRLPDKSLDLDRLLVPLRDAQGQTAAWCVAMPFLRLGDLPGEADPADPESLIAGARAIHAEALAAAEKLRQPGQAIIATGHCHMVGGAVSELSERPLVLGGESALPADIFGELPAYVALGHLHRPQRVGACEHVRYSGSPFPLSMDEAAYEHQVVVADFEDGALREWRPLPVPRFVEFIRVPENGALPPEELLAALKERLPKKKGAPADREDWAFAEVRARLDGGPEPGLRAQVEACFDGRAARLAAFRVERPESPSGDDPDASAPRRSLEEIAPEEIFRRLHAERCAGDPSDELLGAFRELLEAASANDGE